MERTPEQWFRDADRCYLEGHQACAWCGSPHQVHRVKTAHGVQYACNHCDFQISHDALLGRYQLIPGENQGRLDTPMTMHEGSPVASAVRRDA